MQHSRPVHYVRETRLPNGLWAAACYDTTDHADGTITRLADGETLPTGWVWRTTEATRGILHIDISRALTPTAPPLWFVNVDEPKPPRPSTHLVAFTGGGVEPGTVLTRYQFATLGVANDGQLGAIHWYRTGIIRQVFVTREWRRNTIATSLAAAADAFHHANSWPGVVRADGRRTELGKKLVAGLLYPQRIAPLTETMPDMDVD